MVEWLRTNVMVEWLRTKHSRAIISLLPNGLVLKTVTGNFGNFKATEKLGNLMVVADLTKVVEQGPAEAAWTYAQYITRKRHTVNSYQWKSDKKIITKCD